jgi:hypothetical protein
MHVHSVLQAKVDGIALKIGDDPSDMRLVVISKLRKSHYSAGWSEPLMHGRDVFPMNAKSISQRCLLRFSDSGDQPN